MEDSFSSRPEGDTMHSRGGSLTEETFSLTVGGPTNISSTLQISLGRKKAKDGELDIFGAEKYFSGSMDADKKAPIPERGWKEPPAAAAAAKKERSAGRKIKFTTQSTCSSEASGNSRSLLLHEDTRRDSSLINGQNPANRKRFLRVLCCKCSCSGKNSVDVDNKAVEKGGQNLRSSPANGSNQSIQTQLWNKKETAGSQKKDGLGGVTVGLKREVYSTSPNPLLGNLAVGREFEALGPPALSGKESLGSCPGRSLTTLTTIAGGSGGGEREDDLGSESSSDLFEIESISTNPHPYFQQDPNNIGEIGGLAPTTRCYEPSEASIEWSVATASAANFSVASDYGELQVQGAAEVMKKPTRQQRSGLFTGCASDKAVEVVANTHKMAPEKARTEQSRRRPGNGVMPVMKYHYGESCKVADFELVRTGHAFATRCNPTQAPSHHR